MTTAPAEQPDTARGEFLTGAVTGAAVLLFLGTGGALLAGLIGGRGTPVVDRALLAAMALNVALILIGWFRHRRLHRVPTDTASRAHLLARHDALTGLLNRRSLIGDGTDRLARVQRRGKAMALLTIDLDRFGSVNEQHGHATGDALLALVAEAIAATLPPGTLAARIGADEFACLLPFDSGHPQTVDRVAERIVGALAKPFHPGALPPGLLQSGPLQPGPLQPGVEIHIGASIGIARSDLDCGSIDSLLHTAEIALGAARAAGRNRHIWFDRSMERALQERGAIETGLRHAIPAQQIMPYFEQQVDLSTGRIIGFEVLARWAHPTHGLILPDRFIPVAEEIGLIGDLSLGIMRQAFAAARDWDAGLTLSVNVSPLQLRDAWLAQKIIKTLVETGFPAHRLEIEITEGALFDNLPLAQSIVGSLKNQGIAIALDDFGTGYSSLAHLRALPFDRIKIDRSFVASMAVNAESAATVTMIARLGDSLNLPTTAEGIEDEGIADRVRALGCARGQGYLYGRPMGAADVRRLLAERRLLAQGPPDAVGTVTSLRQVG